MILLDDVARAIWSRDGFTHTNDPLDKHYKMARAALTVVVRDLWDYSLAPGHQVSLARVWLEAWLKERGIEFPAVQSAPLNHRAGVRE